MKPGGKIFAFLLLLAVIPQCGRVPKDAPAAEPSAAFIDRPAPFVPSADSTISARQMTAWFSCNNALDSLSGSFTESLPAVNPGRAAGPTLTDSLQRAFWLSQDRICRKKGLCGGYQEYRWILEHLGSPKNKALYDSLKPQ